MKIVFHLNSTLKNKDLCLVKRAKGDGYYPHPQKVYSKCCSPFFEKRALINPDIKNLPNYYSCEDDSFLGHEDDFNADSPPTSTIEHSFWFYAPSTEIKTIGLPLPPEYFGIDFLTLYLLYDLPDNILQEISTKLDLKNNQGPPVELRVYQEGFFDIHLFPLPEYQTGFSLILED